MIDFEYSTLNFRGTDIASYINETVIDYSHPDKPHFIIYDDLLEDFLKEDEHIKLFKYYLEKYHE